MKTNLRFGAVGQFTSHSAYVATETESNGATSLRGRVVIAFRSNSYLIQANGRLTFEDDLRSGGLLYFTTQ